MIWGSGGSSSCTPRILSTGHKKKGKVRWGTLFRNILMDFYRLSKNKHTFLRLSQETCWSKTNRPHICPSSRRLILWEIRRCSITAKIQRNAALSNPVKFLPWVIAMGAWLNSQWAWTSSKSTAEGSVVPWWRIASDKGMRHGTSNGSACAVTMSPSGHKYSYQSLLSTTVLYQDLCQPSAVLSSLSFTHTYPCR